MNFSVDIKKSQEASSSKEASDSGRRVPASAASTPAEQSESTTSPLAKLYRGITSPIRLLPDFLIIGAQRGGTTSLYNYLQTHPCIVPATIKEIHFFDRRYDKGLAWYRGHFPTYIEKYYTERIGKRTFLTGEATPGYLFHPHTAKRIAKALPHAKLIVLLRNPVDRAYSQYYHAVNHGYETLSFEQSIQDELERTAQEREKILQDEYYQSYAYKHLSYLSRGIYVDQLQTWMSLFPREQFLILKSEDFYTDPGAAVKQVLTFLKVPQSQLSMLKKEFKPFNNNEYSRMDPALRKRLVEYFEPHNARLYEFLGVDFGWDK